MDYLLSLLSLGILHRCFAVAAKMIPGALGNGSLPILPKIC